MGKEAGISAGRVIRNAITERGIANIILATGTSQFETLNQLIADEGIDWSNVVMFHLDEYIGLPITHPASFRKYLKERFLTKVPPLKAAFLIDGETDANSECERLGKLISKHPIDVALVGIGENGHLALMILLRTLILRSRTSSSISMISVFSNNSVKDGFHR